MGRIPCTLANFSGFTANQWKNWIIVYSSIALKTVLPEPDYNCWLLFVRACSLLLSGAITHNTIELADDYLCMFCSRFQELYGEESCTFNVHLHLHLKESLMAYGPLHSFWCFSFERYNGILTGYHTNKRDIEEQLMKRFLFDQRVHAMVRSGEISDHNEFLQLIPGFNEESHEGYTWNTFNTFWNMQGAPSSHSQQEIQSQFTIDYSFQSVSPYVSLPTQSSDGFLDQVQCNALRTVYQILHPSYDIQFIPYAYRKIKWITCAGDRIGSQSISTSSSVISAYWPGFSETVEEFRRHTSELRVGVIQYFLLHIVYLTHHDLMPVKKVCHLLAYVLWKKVHRYPLWFGMDSLLSSCDHEPPSAASFIPVGRIQCRCAHTTMHVQFDDDVSHTPEKVFVTVPLRYQISA